jgi:hypothetical protein
MLRQGPEKYGETVYIGTAPLINHDGLYDILSGIHNVVEARFAFDPNTGQLVGIEMFPESNVDPCEVYFSDYREVNSRQLPHRIVVRFGDTVFAEMQVEQYDLDSAPSS